MAKLSWQEHWALGKLKEGTRTLLMLQLPAADTRSRRTQAASLSRSLRRLCERGLATKIRRRVYAATEMTFERLTESSEKTASVGD
jgi:hypothetical protein